MNQIHLHPGRERRILRGHRWVFSNEIAGSLAGLEPGSWVEVVSSRGVVLGSGPVNPNVLIAVRLVCPPGRSPSREFFLGLLRNAAERRRRLYGAGESCLRLVFGESDGLPGLVVDRYGDVVVYQVSTLGMARMEPLMQDLMMEVLNPRALVYRNDGRMRALEGLPLEKGVARGDLPGEIEVEMNGLRFVVDPLNGQKTGLFLDQRENRLALRRYAEGRRVLDLFCYGGGWSLSALAAGAASATGVDESAEAVRQAEANARLNGMEDRARFLREDVFSYFRRAGREKFDLVVLDPPAFAKSRQNLPEALKGYTDLNRRALLALEPGGILITCSCSHHLGEDDFREVLLRAAQASGRTLRLLESRGQPPDHAPLPAMPETSYLKCLILEVV